MLLFVLFVVFGLSCTDTSPGDTQRQASSSPAAETPGISTATPFGLPAVPLNVAIPSGCQITDGPRRADDGTTSWKLTCRDSTHILGPDESRLVFLAALNADGWKGCGVGLGAVYLHKGNLMTGMSFGQGVISLSQKVVTSANCPTQMED
jgi:hypothetical protein